MRNAIVLQALAALILLAGSSALAKKIDMSKDVDTLGGNKPLMDMAQALDPENRARIVQRRTVDRYNRIEMGLSAGAIAGGDTYLQTHSFGANLDYHINPHWAVGFRYNDYGSDLSPEGQRMFDNYKTSVGNNSTSVFPDIDTPQRSELGLVEWYPVYGKINMFDSGIAQFDIYLLGGAGQMELANEGGEAAYTAGGGIGFWISNRFTARMEARWQGYNDKIIDQTGAFVSRHIDQVLGTVGIGFLL